MATELSLVESPIPGLVVLRLPVHADSRGWFKENWQREKMLALGLPDFGPVQNNVSFNTSRGATRGIHAEPWDKFVSVTNGRVFGAWVDLREGESFGTVFHTEIDPGVAVFVPRGVGNAYQTLEDSTAYTYLVNDHWRPGVTYPALNLADQSSNIPWPIPLSESEISDKDRHNPVLDDVKAMAPRKALVIGSGGQLGRALMSTFTEADGVDFEELDIADPVAIASWPWHEYDLVLNAAAYTAVDNAETPGGRVLAWRANATAVSYLADQARRHRLTLVHISTDYVFDGNLELHTEEEPFSPLGVYAQTKAAGDLAVAMAPKHYVLRTSWVVGDGHNFIRTMAGLADRGISPQVVDDQVGRLTLTTELVRAIRHLLDAGAAYGTYNVTNGGAPTSWADVAREVFRLRGRPVDDVTPVSTEEYARGKDLAPRPRHSTLSLAKLEATGFEPEDAFVALARYVASLD